MTISNEGAEVVAMLGFYCGREYSLTVVYKVREKIHRGVISSL